MRTSVYVDGFNLYYQLKRHNAKWLDLLAFSKRVLPATAEVTAINYYTARVSGAVDPDAPRRQQVYLNALATIPEVRVFFGSFLAKAHWRPVLNLPIATRALTLAGNLTTHDAGIADVAIDTTDPRSSPETLPIGRYPNGRGTRKSGKRPAIDAIKANVFTMEEKGSDVNLAVHLVNDAWRNEFDAAAVVTNDTDLVEPIRIVASELGRPVYLICPSDRGAAVPLASVATNIRHVTKSDFLACQFADPLPTRLLTPISKPAGW